MKNFIEKKFQEMIKKSLKEKSLEFFSKRKISDMSAFIFIGKKMRNKFVQLSDHEVIKIGGKPIASVYICYKDGTEENYFIRLSKSNKVIEYENCLPIEKSFEVAAGAKTHEYRLMYV